MSNWKKEDWGQLKCEVCSSKFQSFSYLPRKTCSNKCHRFYIGKSCGIKNRTPQKRLALSKRMRAEKNPNWYGEKVGIAGVHIWIKRHYKKPALCEDCYKVPPYDLANKGQYTRDRRQWEWLCRRCHMLKDGRLEMLRRYVRKNYKG